MFSVIRGDYRVRSQRDAATTKHQNRHTMHHTSENIINHTATKVAVRPNEDCAERESIFEH